MSYYQVTALTTEQKQEVAYQTFNRYFQSMVLI